MRVCRPEYLATVSSSLGLLAEAVKMLTYITPNMADGYNFGTARASPAVSFCEVDLEVASTCTLAWDNILDVMGLPPSASRDALRDNITAATCNTTDSTHSSSAVRGGNPHLPGYELVAMLEELDRTYLHRQIAKLNETISCRLSDRYLPSDSTQFTQRLTRRKQASSSVDGSRSSSNRGLVFPTVGVKWQDRGRLMPAADPISDASPVHATAGVL